MKRYLNILLVACLASSLMAQDFDRMAMADTDLQGTARYVGMSGAFAALGGDVSAVQDNPAALGVFRRSEISITSDWRYAWNLVGDQTDLNVGGQWNAPEVSWVWSIGNAQKQKGLIYNNIILQYHRLKSYTNTTRIASQQLASYTDWMANSANWSAEQGVHPLDVVGEDAWNNDKISWLSLLGMQAGLVGYDTVSNQWSSILGQDEYVASGIEVIESGAMDAYTLGWGGNINNNLYVGLSANFNALSYTKHARYAEALSEGGNYRLNSTFTASGFGFNAAAGVIYRPLDFLRLGASFQTPTWMSVRTENFSRLITEVAPNADILTPTCEGYYMGTQYMLPMRAVLGLAFQVGSIGLVSMEYDYTHAFDQATIDTHWMRLGTEWVVNNNWFFRAGYAYKSNFGASAGLQLYAPYNDVRTDLDFRLTQREQYASAGVGFRNKLLVVDMAYQYHLKDSQQYMMENWKVHDVQTQEHRIVVTLAWSYRR